MPEEESNIFKGSLELNWINKDKSLYYEYDEDGNPEKPTWVDKNDVRVSEPRILKLIEEYGDTSNLKDPVDNALIRGDNLLALRTLVEIFKERDEKDKVKCVYIDPPYNISKAFEYYEDNLEHSQWLSMMRDRLLLIKRLLRSDGIVFVQIDDREAAYLKILMDEIFGRENFLNSICISTSTASGPKTAHKEKTILKLKEYIHVYKNEGTIKLRPLYKKRKSWDTHFNLYFNPESLKVLSLQKILKDRGILSKNQAFSDLDMDDQKFKKFYLDHQDFICQTKTIENKEIIEKSKSIGNEILKVLNGDGEASYYRNGRQLVPLRDAIKDILICEGRELKWEKDFALLLCDFWDDINFNNMQGEGVVSFPASKKPEFLLQRVIHLCTDPGDIVLDSFAGSGTTAAVAHKTKRRWITIEIGKHAETHCIVRLNAVINGKDQDRKNYGGGFRYFKLGDSLINSGKINWSLSYEEIAQALFMNFDYSYYEKVSDEIYIGKSGNNYAFCLVSKDLKILEKGSIEELISDFLEGSKIVIYTNNGIAVRDEDLPDNVSIKKIPESILTKYHL